MKICNSSLSDKKRIVAPVFIFFLFFFFFFFFVSKELIFYYYCLKNVNSWNYSINIIPLLAIIMNKS
jgi:hypothetical protein